MRALRQTVRSKPDGERHARAGSCPAMGKVLQIFAMPPPFIDYLPTMMMSTFKTRARARRAVGAGAVVAGSSRMGTNKGPELPNLGRSYLMKISFRK